MVKQQKLRKLYVAHNIISLLFEYFVAYLTNRMDQNMKIQLQQQYLIIQDETYTYIITYIKMQPNSVKYYLLFFISILSILEPVISLLQISTLSISTSATYTIELSQYLTTAPIGTIIQLELPYQYNSDDLHAGIPYTGSPLTDGFCPVDCASVAVSYSGFIFNITGMFTTAEPLGFRFSILAVLNPRVAVTVSGYIIRAIDTGGNTIYSENAAGRTFLPRTITCTGVATDYTQIGFISTSSLTINPISNPKDQPLTYIQVQFSSNWLSDPISASSLPNDIYCLSSSQPSIICQRNSQILSISGVTFSSTIDIEIHSIQNPSLVFSAGSVTVTTLTSNRYKLDTCTLSLSGFTQDYLRSPTFQITYDTDTQISVLVSVIFPARGFASGTNILFTFPSALPIAGAVCKIYLGSFLLSSVLPTYIPATNSISASPFSSLTFKPNLQLECTGIVRPRAATLIPNITISSSYNGNLIGSIQCCSTVLEPRSSLNVVSILTDKPYLGAANAQYVFKIITSVSLLTTDLIYIYFPKQYQLGIGTLPCTVSSPTAVVSSPTCSLSAGNLIRISSFLLSATSACQLTLTISSISNPSSNPSTTPFQIQLLNSAQQILQLNPSQVVTISASIITIFTVNTVTKVTLQKPVQYVVQFITNGLLQINYHVLIGLPADIGVYEAGLACSIGGKAVGCWWDGAAVVLRVVEAAASNTVNVVVDGIWNPQSMSATQNFYLRILDPNSNIIQISSPTLNTSISMTSPTTFKLAISSILGTTLPSSNLYETSMLQIILVTGITIKSTHKLSISYNSAEIIFTASSACSTGYTCNFDTANSIVNVVTMTSAVGFDTLFFNVSNVRGIVTVPTFTFTLKDSLDFSIMQSTTTAQRFSPDLLSYTLTQSSLLYSGTSDITLTYTLASLSTSGVTAFQSKVSYILVQIPKQYTSSYTNNIYNYTDLNGTINILSVTNPGPSYQSSGYFYLTGFASTGQILAVSISNAKFVLACTMPCRTCSGSVTNCSSCYSWSNYNLFISVAGSGSCVTHCPRFYYQETNTSTCKSCDTNCYQCDQTSGVKCLSCPTSNYLHELDYKCYADCPPGFYQYGLINGAVCRSCSTNCLTCLNDSYCLSCATGLYIYLNKCIANCPPSTYSLTTPSLSCFACSITNCMQCTQSTCFACKPPYYLSSNQCLSTCPFPLYPTITGICKACQCLTCSNYASNCTSCNALKPYLYNNYCYVICPSGMYPGSLNICTACNLNCITCFSDTLCTLCKQGYAILTYSSTNIGCVDTTLCPSNTILTTSTPGVPTCLSCTSPCSTCQISVTFCLTCITNYNFHNNSCVLNCPYPYHSINNYCKKCIAVCQICEPTDPYNCTECSANYFILNNSCYSTCPSGTYTDLLSKSCLTCSSVCKTCANATNCTSCITNFFLFNWFCYSTCPTVPILYYQYNGVCTACQPQCLSCSGSPVACTACSHPDYLYNVVTKQCVFQCTGVYFKSGSNCIACQSPCAACDTTYNSCSSCINSLFLYNGTCVAQCPLGYFGNTTTLICSRCAFPCKICMQTQCLLCESFAYMYEKSCVLSCPDDMPYEQPGYCSDCIGIGFCARCSKSTTTGSQICSKCVYPYVLFQENCLNECPTNYTATKVDSARVCEKNSSYLEYLSAKQKFNQPIIPPFLTLGLYLLISCILLVLSHRVYRFTYYVGFMLGFISAFDSLFTYYCIYYIYTRYEGEYIPLLPILPLAFLCSALVYNNIIMTIVYWILVLQGVYLPDIRYKQWKQKINCYWWALTILMPFLGGHRLHKINYSKIFGIERFSFRIVSVQKFYQEDIITYCTSLGDIIQIAAVTVGIYNVFIQYNGILLIGYECIAIKIIEWLLTLYDLKKPDRGFFIGDQQEAEQQINKELEQEQRKLNRVDTQHFAKLVRTKSAQLIRNPKYFGNIDIDDFISVYNPDDYEEVIKVPNKKIQKNIYRGKYRRGRKITIEQKLQKFVDTIKPKPKIEGKRVNSYLHKLIYWKPPQMKTKAPTKVLPQSEQSLLALLQKKQQEYKEDLDDIVMVDDEKQGRYYARPRYDQRTFLDDLDETIPNQTVQFFYPSHSIENTAQKQNSLDFDDLMNLNYAKKKHLQKQEPNEFESKRKLHNQPQKKRRNLKGFGQMVLKNDY